MGISDMGSPAFEMGKEIAGAAPPPSRPSSPPGLQHQKAPKLCTMLCLSPALILLSTTLPAAAISLAHTGNSRQLYAKLHHLIILPNMPVVIQGLFSP